MIAHHDMGVVIDPSARNKALQIGGEAFQRQAGHEIGEVKRMGADITGGATRAGFGGIGAPVGLFLTGGFERFGQPVLRIFDLHKTDVAKRACIYHGFGLPDHRIASVIVRQREDHARRIGGFGKFLCLGQCRGQRFIADHMDAAFDELQGGGRVHVVGGDDGNRFDAVFAAGLLRGHFLKTAIGAWHAKIGGRGKRFLRAG